MGQTIIVTLIVAAATWFVVRRLARQLGGKEKACCGGGEGTGQEACAACQAAGGPAPQGLDQLARGCGAQAETCPHPTAKAGDGRVPEPAAKTPGARPVGRTTDND